MALRALWLASLGAAVAANVVSIGLQLPLSDPVACVEGWQYFHIARTAARFIETTEWWRATGATLRLEVLPSADPFTAWSSAAKFAMGPAPTCTHADGSPCRVLRAAIVGPASSEATQLVKLVTREGNMVQVAYGATASVVTPSPYKPLNTYQLQPFFRASYTDETVMGGLWALIKSKGWKMFSILHARDELGDASVVAMQDLVQRDETASAAVWAVSSFDPGDRHSVDAALGGLDTDEARVIVLFAYSNDAALVMQRAYDMGLTGKGWTWLGGEWVREFTWIASATHVDYAAADAAANNVTEPEVKVGDGGAGGGRLLRNSIHTTGGGSGGTTSEKDTTAVGYRTRNPDLAGLSPEELALKHAAGVASRQGARSAQGASRRASAASSWWGPSAKAASLTVPSAAEKVLNAMQGVVGVVPYRIPMDSTLGGYLDRFKPELVADPAFMTLSAAGAFPPPTIPTEGECYLLYNAPVTTVGLPLDLFGPYIFNAIYAVAAATVDAMSNAYRNGTDATRFATVTSGDIGVVMSRKGAILESPLTGTTMHWLGNGDRVGSALSLVNVRGDKIVTVAAWHSSVVAGTWNGSTGSVLASGVRMSDGAWENASDIYWPGGQTLTPPDRAPEYSHAAATALVVGLVGIIISLLVGAVLHHAHVTILPESGSTVLIGCAFGVLLRFMFGAAVKETAEFSSSMFMLVLLPIIIFESGFSLDRKSFFTQLFSICAFAILGTLLSTFIIGLIVWWLGSNGTITMLSWEEAMSFASLLSATDPVATLAVFSSLRVHPTLYALVYGEAVINDAVAIVLYRTFTGFLTAEITTNAALWAIGTFCGILFFSVMVGVVMGMAATLSFRYVNVTGQGREVKWEKDFAAKLSVIKKLVPKIPHINLNGDAKAAPALAPTPVSSAVSAPTPHAEAPPAAADSGETVDLLAGIKETGILLLFAYVSFSFAEAIGLSGIVSSLITGITMNMYTSRVLSRDGRLTSTAIFKMLSNLADTAIFFQIGLNVVLNLHVGDYNMPFILWTLVACLLGRAANIFILSYYLNQKRKEEITWAFQLQMWHAGLRGAIAYATALSFPSQHRDMLVNATSWICLFTIFFLGGTTTTTLNALKIPYNIEQSPEQSDALIAENMEASRVKSAMAWVDKWIQRIVYGRKFVQEMDYVNAVAEQKAKIRAAKHYGIVLKPSDLKPILPPHDEEEDAAYHMGHGLGGGNKYVTGRRPEPDSDSEDIDGNESETESEGEGGGELANKLVASGRSGRSIDTPGSGTGLGLHKDSGGSEGDTRHLLGASEVSSPPHTSHMSVYLHHAPQALSPILESPTARGVNVPLNDNSNKGTPVAPIESQVVSARGGVVAHATPTPAPEVSWDAVDQAVAREEAARGLIRLSSPGINASTTGATSAGTPGASRNSTAYSSPATVPPAAPARYVTPKHTPPTSPLASRPVSGSASGSGVSTPARTGVPTPHEEPHTPASTAFAPAANTPTPSPFDEEDSGVSFAPRTPVMAGTGTATTTPAAASASGVHTQRESEVEGTQLGSVTAASQTGSDPNLQVWEEGSGSPDDAPLGVHNTGARGATGDVGDAEAVTVPWDLPTEGGQADAALPNTGLDAFADIVSPSDAAFETTPAPSHRAQFTPTADDEWK